MEDGTEHDGDSGEILGQETDNLEGYEMREKGYFGPGKLPHFDRAAFEFPNGTREDVLFKKFKAKVEANGSIAKEEAMEFASDLSDILDEGVARTDE